MGVGTWRRHPFGARVKHNHGFTASKLGRRFGDLDGDEFTGKSVSNKDDASVGQTSDGTPGSRPFNPNGALKLAKGLVTHLDSLLSGIFVALGHEGVRW
jgi:hypothetical protein